MYIPITGTCIWFYDKIRKHYYFMFLGDPELVAEKGGEILKLCRYQFISKESLIAVLLWHT